jgi:hypothetical protein
MVSKLHYSDDEFINFIDELNEIKGSYTDVPAARGLIFGAGYSYNFFSVTGPNTVPSVAIDYENKGSMMFEVGYIKPVRKGNGRYFIYPNLKVFSYSTSGSLKRFDAVITSEFECDMVLFPALEIGYNLIHKAGVKWYASAGFGALMLFDNTETFKYVFNDGSTVSGKSIETNVAFDINVSTGIFLFNRYKISLGYNIPAATSNDQYYTGYLSGAQFGAGYKF